MDGALDVLFFIEHWINNRDAWPPRRHAHCFGSVVKADDRLCPRGSRAPHGIREGRREARDIASWDDATRKGPAVTGRVRQQRRLQTVCGCPAYVVMVRWIRHVDDRVGSSS